MPSLATRAVQIYYFYEPLAGAAVLLGLALDRARWRLLGTWLLVVAAIGWLGVASNRTSHYTWRFTADQVARLREPVVERYRDRPLDTLVLVTDGNIPFWEYALQQPLLAVLLHRPTLQVAIVDSSSLSLAALAPPQRIALDLDNGLVPWDPAAHDTRAPQAVLRLVRVSPAQATGAGFQCAGERRVGSHHRLRRGA